MKDSAMKITAVTTTLLTGPSTNDRFLREARRLRSAAFIEVHTDAGLTGIGETYAGYFCPEAIPPLVDFYAPILIGSDASIAELYQRMAHCGNYWSRVGLGAAVINGIEAALWDLKGKQEGVPVYELLGGAKHEKIPAYATGGPSNYPLDRLAEKADYYLSLGFSGFKVATGSYTQGIGWYSPIEPAEAADFESGKLEFLRRHCGPDIRIMLDGHMGNSVGKTWKIETALAVAKALEPYNLFFFEEPLHYTDPWGYAELCRSTAVPIAGGECLTSTYEWRVFTECDAFDIGQPDAAFTGGLGEFLRVAEMLHERGRGIATHAWGAAGSLMQNVHCGFAAPNTRILEVAPDYAGLHADLLDGSFVMRDGCVLPPPR
ncbi:MAG: mandelate racemase/muconate lactonizing enzyme family protein, partial [Bryobacterales bacterium]|nr:mandelate racemase/muconate lactonizing enzyme family protein [Bryobacterales bacterium]